MESIEKLRTAARNMAKGRNLENHEECNLLLIIADEIKREIAEKYIQRPVDADGMPIRVGDSIEYPNGRRDVVRFITINASVPTFNERGWVASECHHVNPRTVEDVLREFATEYHNAANSPNTFDSNGIINRCADELRELLGGDK